jgi:hypothetical protein
MKYDLVQQYFEDVTTLIDPSIRIILMVFIKYLTVVSLVDFAFGSNNSTSTTSHLNFEIFIRNQ